MKARGGRAIAQQPASGPKTVGGANECRFGVGWVEEVSVTKTKGPTDPVQFLSAQEVAGLFQVPLKTIYQWRYLGEGPPSVRIGRHLRFDPADVARWVQDRKALSAVVVRGG
ncbi:MAG: helix-turn-helix transcriptional regulator [Actinomycetota bacterium]